MKDLTQGSIVSHISVMAPQIFAGMIMMMLCGLIDLYFVAGLGDAAIAGVGAAGNAGFLINALTQILSVGTRVADFACGRTQGPGRCQSGVQSVARSVGGMYPVSTLVAGCLLARSYMRSIAADDAVIEAGTTYLLWFMPALALQFVVLVMGSALRGTGIVRPTVIVQTVTVILNMLLAPVLISGWGTNLAARRCRRGPGEHDRGRDRRGDDVDLFPPLRALRRHRPRIVASATGAMEAHPEHRAAGRRRVRHHLRQHGGDLLCAAAFRRRGPGGLWHRPAPAGRRSHAGDLDRAWLPAPSPARTSAPATASA